MPPNFPPQDFAEYEGYLDDGETGDEAPGFHFRWLPEIEAKLLKKHSVRTVEVEQVFANKPFETRKERGDYPGEDIYEALGVTDAGRYLVIYFIKKLDGRYLIITAYDMKPAHRRRYDEHS